MIDDFVFVEGGNFNPKSFDYKNSKTYCKSYIEPFCISKYQVKQSLYFEIANHNPSNFKNPNSPVEMISWFEAIEFSNKLSIAHGFKPYYSITELDIISDLNSNGYRLPSEMEWEFAASGGVKSKGYTYSGSNDLSRVGWYKNNSNGNTHPVGLKSSNELGIFDMSGNVWEWCFDGFSSQNTKIYRGGSFLDFDYGCTVSVRGHRPPNLRQIDIGFRLVRNFL